MREDIKSLDWVTKTYGGQHDGGLDANLYGYDLGSFTREFVKANHHEDKSFLEILLTRGPKYTYKRGRSYEDHEEWTTKTGTFDWTQVTPRWDPAGTPP